MHKIAGFFWLPHIHLNRSYRDHLFRFLFKDKRDLLELYNALNGSDYRDPNALESVILEDVIFLKMKHDLFFIIGDRLNLYEHQSTKNPNMPLRGFLYFARQYEGLVAAGKRSLYGNAMVPLPTPKYVVFYNGTEELEDETTLYLSDAFSEGRGIWSAQGRGAGPGGCPAGSRAQKSLPGQGRGNYRRGTGDGRGNSGAAFERKTPITKKQTK